MIEINYFESAAGRVPVQNWMDELKAGNKNDLKLLRSVLFKIDLLESLGKNLRRPHSECLTKGRRQLYHIYELIIPFNKEEYRIFYSLYNDDLAILLHWVHKKTQEVDKRDIELSLNRMKDWVARNG